MPRCTKLAKHKDNCEHNSHEDGCWALFSKESEEEMRCDFHVVVMPYNDFLDKFESRDE